MFPQTRCGVCGTRLVCGDALVAEVLDLILPYVAVVLVERAGELVRAVVPADKIQVVGIGWIHRGLERCFARRRNWARREAGVPIGVVRRIEVEVVASKIAVVLASQ